VHLTKSKYVLCAISAGALLAAPPATISGSISGRILDEQGRPVAGATVVLRGKVSGYRQAVSSDSQGRFILYNLPFSDYQFQAGAPGFDLAQRELAVRSSLPQQVDFTLKSASATVVVEAKASLLTDHPSSSQEIDRSTIEQAPAAVQSRALESILLTTPGFIQDENGRFHFRGSHGQVMYMVDGVPVTDQVQATFSNSMDPAQVESMEVITGGVSAEYGGKPGAVVNMTSKSGLGTPGGFAGELSLGAARFRTLEAGTTVRGGNDEFGYFATVAGSQSDRFLDPVNFDNLHNHGATGRVFTRFDRVLSESDSLRLSFSGGQTNRDVVNLASQEAAGMNQRVADLDQNASVAWTHLLSASRSLNATVFYRHSDSRLTPTEDLQPGFTAGSPDTPEWVRHDQRLDNQGMVLSYTQVDGGNNLKTGLQYVRYPIHETFAFAITNPAFEGITGPSTPLYAYTPAGGGNIFQFDDHIAPALASIFLQDDLKAGNLSLGLGLRYDSYTLRDYTQAQWQPRLGAAYLVPATGTQFRAVYDRLMITPENEGLAVSTSQQVWNAISGGSTPVAQLRPERQNSFLVGVDQQLGKVAKVMVEYWWKTSVNTADNSQFLNTGLLYPIAAARGVFHGLDLRLDVIPVHGWSGYISAGTVRTVFYNPTVGGLDAANPANQNNLPYLIDHDQKLTLQTGVRYQHQELFGQVICRFDSGLVAGDPAGVAGNPDYAFGIPYVHQVNDSLTGTYWRVNSRTVWDLNGGDAFKFASGRSLLAELDLLNVFNEKAIYNFLSTFGGTHVIPPRTLAGRIKYRF
jgi:outer membrane receptor for Fe3+-dicitrate